MSLSNCESRRIIGVFLAVLIFFTVILAPLSSRNAYAEKLGGSSETADISDKTDPSKDGQTYVSQSKTGDEREKLLQISKDTEITSPKLDNEDPEDAYHALVSEFVDDKGYVTDDALEGFRLPVAEDEQFYEIADNADGSKELKLYLQPIKYKDGEDWVDIDNSLVLKDASTAKADMASSSREFETKASDVKITLSEDLSAENAITYSYADYSIGFSPQGVIKKSAAETSDSIKLSKTNEYANASDAKKLTAKEVKIGSLIGEEKAAEFESLEYEGTFNKDANIKITPTYMGVKEEIILETVPKETEFSYVLNVEKLVPLLREDGNLYFVDIDTKTIIATIAAPLMWDASPESKESYDIAVKLSAIGDDKYRYTLIPDEKFLKAEDTTYPVTIDPSINTTTSNIVDTFISSKYSSRNYSSDTHMKIGYSPTFDKSRGMVKINAFPSVLAGNEISKVTFTAYQDYTGSSSPVMDIAQITESWNVSTITWANVPKFGTVHASTTVKDVKAYSWTITNLAKGWHSGSIKNYGMYLKIPNESVNYYKRFCSEENETAANRPYFTFTFKDTTPPPVPTSFSIASSTFNGKTGTVKLKWSSVTDLPAKYASGLDYYRIAYRKNKGSWSFINVGTALTYSLTNISSNASYDYAVRAVDKNGNMSAWKYLNNQTTPDKIGPTAPTAFSISPASWTNSDPTITWSGITDDGDHLQKVQYRINGGSWINIGTTNGTASGSYTIDMSSQPDGEYTINIRGVDSQGNNGTVSAAVTYYKDTTAPEITSFTANKTTLNGIVRISATISNVGGSGFDNWTLQYGMGNPAPDFNGTLASGTKTPYGVIFEWDTSELVNNNYYTLRLTAKDAVGNTATAPLITLLKTSSSVYIASELQITSPKNEANADNANKIAISNEELNEEFDGKLNVTYVKTSDNLTAGLKNQKLYVNNVLHDSGENLVFNAAAYDNGWVYPEGGIANIYVQASDSQDNILYSTGTYEAREIYDTFKDSSKIENLQNVTVLPDGIVRLSDMTYDSEVVGSFESKVFEYAGDVSYIDLVVDQYIPSSGGSIEYFVSLDHGATWQSITPVSTDGGVTRDLKNRKLYENAVGDNVKLKAVVTKPSGVNQSPTLDYWAMDVRYTTYTNAVVIENDFSENMRGIGRLENAVHDAQNECIKVGSKDFDASGHYVYSTLRTTPNDVIEMNLKVDEAKPEGTNITYSVSLQGGAEGTWQEITPTNSGESGWVDATHAGKQIVLRAEFDTKEKVTPVLNSWKLSIKQKTAGQPYVVKLVDEPKNFSAIVGANYMTLLRWEASKTEDVTYNVYRSETPFYDIADMQPIAEGLKETYWNDYNLNYGKKFYYRVTAVKELGGHARESLPSYEAWAKVVDENEIDKMLGLQNYWTYSGFKTGSGTGYVNVANGNVAYMTTDIVVSDPFLAAVMRRTFNSDAKTKTAMGYGWDFSFNTALMREFKDHDGDPLTPVQETAMILKDGDGSLHRFEKIAENSYESAKGTFMELTYCSVTENGREEKEYQIKRKDGIVYHYNAQTMLLKKFSDANNNALSFSYDSRGNIASVTNNVGETVELSYIYSNAQVDAPDYTYVNEHPDMLASVSWTPEGAPDSSIVYNYTYTENDMLASASTVIEDDTDYKESFTYTDGKLVNITDPKGNVTSFHYDGRILDKITLANGEYFDFSFGQPENGIFVTTVTDNNGVAKMYKYDAEGLLKEKTDALGNWVRYAHNSDFLVTKMSYPDFTGGSTPISYTYVYDEKGNITKISGPNGSETTYSYKDNGLKHNKPSTKTVQKSANSSVTTIYEYDTSGNLTKIKDSVGTTTYTYGLRAPGDKNHGKGYLLTQTDQYGAVTVYTYDTKGRVSTVTVKDDKGNIVDSRTYSYKYNDDGYYNSVAVTDAFNQTTTTYYDKLGRERRVNYPDTKFNTDTNSYEIFTMTEYDLAGNVTRTFNRAGEEVSYGYDALNRMVSAEYPDESTNFVSYDKWDSDEDGKAESDLIIKTDGEGVRTAEYYDKAGRLVKTSLLGKAGAEEIVTAKYEYDSAGNCKNTTDAAKRKTEAIYNKLGQKIQTIADPKGANVVVNYTYDLLGNQLSVTDAEGGQTSYTYDNASRLSSVTQKTDSGNLVTQYGYDDKAAHSGYITNRIIDANGNVKETVFDKYGRKIKEISAGPESEDAETKSDDEKMTTKYEYDKSRVSEITRNDGTKEKYTYDVLGQVRRVDYYDATDDTSVPSTKYLEYKYDELGNVTQESIYHGKKETTTAYTFDSMGRIATMTQGSLAKGGVQTTYAYNGADQVTAVTYVKGVDENNTVQERTLGYTYDNYGRISAITLKTGNEAAKKVREYIYNNDNGELDSTKDFRDFENNADDYIKTAYTMNKLGLTTNITYTDHKNEKDTGTKKEEYTMAYDKRGYIKSETAYTNYGTSNDDAKTVEKKYEYDKVGRLVKATVGDDVKEYTYDKVGNRVTMSDGKDTFKYGYNQFNQLMSVTKNDKEYTKYTYDDRGNQLTEKQLYMTVDADKYYRETAYTYDLRNNMTKAEVTTPDYVNNQVTTSKVTQTNAYNASGRRIQKVEGGETTNYYYMGSALLFSSNANNWLLTENVLDPNGIIVASARFDDTNPAESKREGFYFYHYDMRGSTTAIVGANGKLQKGYSYDTFGAIEESGNKSFLNEVTFTGSVTDNSTGLQYMNSRFYDSSTGRFLTQDSYSGNPYDPWTQHLYSYCGNNPVNMVDPTGHFFNFIAAAVGAVVGAASGVVINGISNAIQGKNFWDGAGIAAVGGAITGLAAGFTCGASVALSAGAKVLVAAGAYGLTSTASSVVTQGMKKGFKNVSAEEAIVAGVSGAVSGAIGQGISNAVSSSAGKPLYNTSSTPSVTKTNASMSQNGSTADIRFTQKTASYKFSNGGRFSGETIGEVSDMLRNGTLQPNDVPVNYVSRGGKLLVENTRSTLALLRSGTPFSEWILNDCTGNLPMMNKIDERLARNGLDELGSQFIRITGGSSNCSFLG